MRLEVHPTTPQPRIIKKTVDVLKRGGTIVYPTDTVYAVGCDIFEKKALNRVYQIKQMDKNHPVAFVCADLSDIAKYAIVDDRIYRFMKRLLPGPYTFILPATREVPRILMMKRKTVGIRVPDHPVPQAIVKELGNPIVSTSATWEGEQLNDPDDLAAHYKQCEVVLDAGWGPLEPSTVLDLTGESVEIVRVGAGPVDDL
ncbi:MAG: threonylcarbamoyl-AMP synthase [Deltaproteobacteria bacterium]|nr:threonylcarbamoyl-AMP synthase [Deltaproteobacteria bacterium]